MRTGAKHTEEVKETLRYKRKLQYQAQGINSGCFKKGHKPWNKGMPALGGHETRFKKGERVGEQHPSWLGGVQVMDKDCVYLHTGCNERVRRPRKLWEDANGKIPKGMCIYHKDGNKYNDNLSNLSLISRAELLRLNRGGR